MTNEFIYSIRNIFSDEPGSVFHATKTRKFYIGPYQRSYKWQSEGDFDQVPQLLNDVYDAWQNNPDSEYYLQYITLKADRARQWLEVIDGQQRLTTLSLLFYQLGQLKSGSNIAADRLIYSRYDNGNIFNEICEQASACDVYVCKDFKEQDRYYMFAASKCIQKRLWEWKDQNELEDLKRYLLDNVKIIVNFESHFVKSEDIFANLNDNHVPLTDAYLIKGLLLTNAVSRINAYGRNQTYTEIQEKRKNLGRMWDEIQTWITDKEHSHFFFKHTEIGKYYDQSYSMEYFLELAFLYKYEEERGKVVADYSRNSLELFNRYNSRIKSTGQTVEMVETIKHVYHKIVTIYESSLYNLWGFVQFSKRQNNGWLDVYSCLDKSEQKLRIYLANESIRRIPRLDDEKVSNENFKTLRYQSRNDRLTNLLLSFSVFLPMMESKDYRFRYYDYEEARWSFEHISPQNPKGQIAIPDYARLYVLKEVGRQLDNPSLESEEKGKLENVRRQVQEGEKIDVNDMEFMFDADVDKDSLGNMALLSREDNSANSNNPFMMKKLIIQNRKGKGAFIPNHTYEAFNKILVSPSPDKPFSADLFVWSQQDIDAHVQWMIEANSGIIHYLYSLRNWKEL